MVFDRVLALVPDATGKPLFGGYGVFRRGVMFAGVFRAPRADIAAQGYDLSLNRYKEVVHEVVEHRPPADILNELAAREATIQKGMKELGGMLKGEPGA